MSHRRLVVLTVLFLISLGTSSAWFRPALHLAEPGAPPQDGFPVKATRCDGLEPLQVELTPVTAVRPLRTVRFQVRAVTNLDPHQLERVSVEYELPQPLRMVPDARSGQMSFAASRSARTEFGLWLPDDRRREIRAIVTAETPDGRTVSGVGVYWTGHEEGDLPPGAVRKLVDPDGSEIIVYQGERVR